MLLLHTLLLALAILAHPSHPQRTEEDGLGKRGGAELVRMFLSALGGGAPGGRSPIPFRPVRRIGSEFLGKRSGEPPRRRLMGAEFLGKRRMMGSEFLGKRATLRRMGNEFLGKRRVGNEFLGKRATLPLHDDHKRAMGNEFLGKRGMGNEFLGKRVEEGSDEEERSKESGAEE